MFQVADQCSTFFGQRFPMVASCPHGVWLRVGNWDLHFKWADVVALADVN